jgi:uncharacterized protein YeaO (DUF488 family)
MVTIKRVYEPASSDDGRRVLVDRLWPRGLSKENAHIDEWLKEVAPTKELRTWFAHDPAKWSEFRTRYQKELAANPAWGELIALAQKHPRLTLLYGAHDTEHNQAVVLKDFLDK